MLRKARYPLERYRHELGAPERHRNEVRASSDAEKGQEPLLEVHARSRGS